MAKIRISVRMFTDAMLKYVTGRLLQPAGKVGAHARQGSVPHSKAWGMLVVIVIVIVGMRAVRTYVYESYDDCLDGDEGCYAVYAAAEFCLREDTVVEGEDAGFYEE
jgi:hypothetical protein